MQCLLPSSALCHSTAGRAGGPKHPAEQVKVIPLPRANNISIMLTQFAEYRSGALEVRHAVLTGTRLGLERLSLLLQVGNMI